MDRPKILVITSDVPHKNMSLLCPGHDGILGEWQILYNPPKGTKCDFWIVFTASRPRDWIQCAPENTLYLAGEPPSKKVHPENFYAQFHYVYSCNPKDPHPRVELGAPCLNWHVGLNTDTHEYRFGSEHLSELKSPQKINKISVVCSNLTTTEGQRKRLKFLEHLKSELGDSIIHFGRGFTPIPDKFEAILPYAYHLVLENSETAHYWTEKLSDAYLGYAFPFIHLSDIDSSEQTLKVLGKGNKFRIVPLGRKAIEALDLWILQRNKLNKLVDGEFLFLNQQGRKLTARAIQYRLKFWAQKNNIPENIHPHLLRHSFASHVLQSSQDLRAVQELLGHSNISTTQIYTHLDFQHLSKIYDQAHPRSKKKID